MDAVLNAVRTWLLALVAVLFPMAAHAAEPCVPTNAPPGSTGCRPTAPSAAGADYLDLYQPGQAPNSQHKITVDNLFNGRAGPGGSISGATSTSTGATTARAEADRYARVIDILDYGGKNDLVSFSDGVWSAGSSAFSSPLGDFTAADVGKPIYLSGAGPNGTTFSTTIAAVPGAHALTLAGTPSADSTARYASVGLALTGQSGAGSYAPGDTLTCTGGTFTVACSFTVLKTKAVSATVNAAGSGGTNSTTLACVVTATTGTGRPARFAVTVTAGAIASLDSVWDTGEYTVNPTSLVAEPVTGCGLTGATLTLNMGVSIPKLMTPGIYSVLPAAIMAGTGAYGPVSTTTGGSGTGALLGIAFNPISGTTGIYATGSDNTAAISAAMARANTLYANGVRSCVYFPAQDSRYPTGMGYLVVSEPTPFSNFNPGCVKGDGPNRTYIRLGANFTGDLFAWSNAWWKSDFSFAGTAAISTLSNGAYAEGISVFGDTASPGQQNAFMLRDWVDNADFESVQCWYVHGYCLGIGGLPSVNSSGQNPTRESRFHHIHVVSSGSETIPSILLANKGVGNGTDQLYFEDFRVLRCISKCILLDPQEATLSQVKFVGFSIERSMSGDDLMVLGTPTAPASVNAISVISSYFFQTSADHAALRISQGLDFATFAIDVEASFSNGTGHGLVIDGGRAMRIKSLGAAVPQAAFVVGSSPTVGSALVFDLQGTANETFLVDPGSTAKVVTSFRTQGSPGSIGANAVNLQPIQSVVGNTAQGDNSVVVGNGTSKTTTAATNTVVLGPGQIGTGVNSVMAGLSNVNTGLVSWLSGVGACDSGRNRSWEWAVSTIAAACDSQVGMHQLKGLTVDATPLVLTTNSSGVPGLTNMVGTGPNHIFTGPVTCSARDQVTNDRAVWYDPTMVLSEAGTIVTTSLDLSTLTKKFNSAGAAAWTLTTAANTTTGGVALTATGAAAATIHWMCLWGPLVELQ